MLNQKIGRNDLCPCGSGKKYKQCCMARDQSKKEASQGSEGIDVLAMMQTAADYFQAGSPDLADMICQEILQLKPRHADALHLSGILAMQRYNIDRAIELIGRAIKERPSAEMYSNLGSALKAQGKLDEAVVSYRKAILCDPKSAEAHNNLGLGLRDLGQLENSATSLRKAVALRPDFSRAHFNLGVVLRTLGQLEASVASFRQAAKIEPNYADAHSNLGALLQQRRQLDEALECLRRAEELQPDAFHVHYSLGTTLQELGQLDDAVTRFRQALVINPDASQAHSTLLFCLNYHPDLSADVIFAEYRRWNEVHARPLIEAKAHENLRDPERRMRVGYISPDLRKHSVHHFIVPLLAQHDKMQVEVYAYADVPNEDAVSAQCKGYVDHWRNTVGMGDQALADTIRQDQIDILVDLAGHTAGNRLLVLARKPAPIQVSWLGYGYTTGMDAIDYFLGNAEFTPPGCESLFAEQVVHLPASAVYRPDEGMGEPGQLPSVQNRGVTFGTLSRAMRINHRVIRVWAEMLNRLPGSRLIINCRDFQSAGSQTRIRQQFAAHGVDGSRLEIGFESPPWNVLRKIDIALDCFPHNSGTTLIEGLYLGVPYITLRDRPSVGRIGAAFLRALGHTEWIADSEEEYIDRALALAGDIDRLANLRATLRQQLEASVLMDEAGFAHAIESAYRTMWQRWCSEN